MDNFTKDTTLDYMDPHRHDSCVRCIIGITCAQEASLQHNDGLI